MKERAKTLYQKCYTTNLVRGKKSGGKCYFDTFGTGHLNFDHLRSAVFLLAY